MTNLTAIKVPVETRDHLRDAAKSAGVSQWVLIEQMLKEREDAEFWRRMAETSPDEYWAALRADGDTPAIDSSLLARNTADETADA